MARFIEGRIVPYAFQTESQGRSPEYLSAYEDRKGNLWAFGDTYLINLAEGQRFNYFRSSEPASVRIWSLCEGRNGRLWIGTSGRGLLCFEDNRFQPVMLGENRWPYDVRAICEDRDGNLWLGTSGGGLVQLRLQSVRILRSGQGLPDSAPTALALDADGRVYVGLQRGGLWVGDSGRFDQMGGGDGLELQSYISAIAVARDGGVWAGTLGNGLFALRNGRGVHLTTADGLANDTVLAVCVDGHGAVWASSADGALSCFADGQVTRFDAAQGLPDSPITAMTPAGDGLWLGDQDGEITREENGKFFRVDAAGDWGRHSVLALCEGEQKHLWIGLDGGGLICLTNGGAMNWSSGGGLPSDVVAGIAEDDAHNLWLATGAGIYRVNGADARKSLGNARTALACKFIAGAKSSTDSGAVTGGARVLVAPDQHLWFATSDGVLNVDTRQTEVEPAPLPVYLESASVNGAAPFSLLQGALWKASDTHDAGFRAPDLRSLDIRFTALGFTAPEEIQFRHRLEGYDSEWVDDGNTRLAHYGRLNYGNYRFRVAARNVDGAWQEAGDTFSFLVPTPLYFQRWAICLYVIAAVALVAGVVRVISHRRLRFALARLEQQQALERERMRIARDMHDEMGSKLTKISFLSEHVSMEAGSDGPLAAKIQSIAQTSRDLLKTMDEIVWVVNPRNDTLENLVAYFSHYAAEYFQNTSTECELQLPKEVPRQPMSSEARHNLFLTFEEALNNVLKHAEAKNVKVEMAALRRDFEIKITDDGRGFSPEAVNGHAPGGRSGNGLKNMRRQRLAAIGGECVVSSRTGGGAMVTLRIPLNSDQHTASI